MNENEIPPEDSPLSPGTGSPGAAPPPAPPPPPPPPPGGGWAPGGFPPPPVSLRLIPFEDPGRPVVTGFFETVRLFILQPEDGFRRITTRFDLFRPLVFAVFITWVGAAFECVYESMLQGVLATVASEYGDKLRDLIGSTAGRVVTLAIWPFVAVVATFVGSAVMHLCLMIVGGANRGFVTTVRVGCYADVSALAQVVPVAGGLAYLVWSLVLKIVGLAAAHETTIGKAAFAVLLPFLLCCGCCIGLLVFSGAAILGGLAK